MDNKEARMLECQFLQYRASKNDVPNFEIGFAYKKVSFYWFLLILVLFPHPLTTGWISGFIEAEGCFYANFTNLHKIYGG